MFLFCDPVRRIGPAGTDFLTAHLLIGTYLVVIARSFFQACGILVGLIRGGEHLLVAAGSGGGFPDLIAGSLTVE